MSKHQTHHSAHAPQRANVPRRQEQGYALLSILVAMTITVVIMAAAVPSFKHEAQREREEEMFWRGAQVAHAIAVFKQTHNQQFPTKLEDLIESFETGGKKKRLLRPSALRDPMTQKGEWVAVRLGDPLIAELYSAYLLTVKQPPVQNSVLAQVAVARGGAIVGGGLQNTSPSLLSAAMQSGNLHSEFGPIVGVVSASKEPLIRNYYGLETYDHSAFIDGTRMPGVMVNYPVGGGGANGKAPINNGEQQGCKDCYGSPCKGQCILGKCTGAPVRDPNCSIDDQRAGKCTPRGC